MSLIMIGSDFSDSQLMCIIAQVAGLFCMLLTYAVLLCQQINRFNKAENRALLITDRHLYKMDPVKQYKPMKSIPLYNVNIYLILT